MRKKMDPELKVAWLEALRSGKYRQGAGSLCSGEYYCCLGVLGNITPGANWSREDELNDYALKWENSRKQESFLPTSMGDRVGITKDTQRKLAEMNDGGYSFSEIADWIEEHL